MAVRDQRRMHRNADPLGPLFDDTEKFDAIAQLRRVPDLLLGQPANALHVHTLHGHRETIGQRGQQRRLVRGIMAVNIQTRLRLRIAGGLGRL